MMHSGTNSRLVGFVVVAVELAVFLVPVSVLPYVPKFFFGGVLAFIGLEIASDWLISAYMTYF